MNLNRRKKSDRERERRFPDVCQHDHPGKTPKFQSRQDQILRACCLAQGRHRPDAHPGREAAAWNGSLSDPSTTQSLTSNAHHRRYLQAPEPVRPRLSTNSHTDILPIATIMRRPIRRLREHAGTTRTRRRTMAMKTLRITRHKREPSPATLPPEIIRIGIHLADIVTDPRMQIGSPVRVLELQRAGREIGSLATHFERDAVVGVGGVGFRMGAAVGGEGLDRVAAGGLACVRLVAALEDDGEGAGVTDVGLADSAGGGGVDGGVGAAFGGPLVVEEGLGVG